ncbi:MAG: molecular chaperone HtpG [Candidatus Aureabacteria bacterium]|nr:molecular chaperone HtpG [Candidatus Auribacterota bacterium]
MTERTPTIETRSFETQIQQLLDLMAHSLYSNKDIFIRELISNSSDAIDKIRFLSLTKKELLEDDSRFEIKISLDKDAKIFIISDNGIGMNHEEIIQNIGTIASSGSKDFIQAMSQDQAKNLSLIGQFGVGFYSVFMVSKKVTLFSRKAGEKEAWKWESTGKGSYTIEPAEKKNRGTEVILHLNEEGEEFLENWKVRSVIRKFSDYVSYPILMPKTDNRSEEEKKKEPEKKSTEYEVVNTGQPLWIRPKKEITDDMYDEFYKQISHDFEKPLTKVHFSQEGVIAFNSILFIPTKAPLDFFHHHESKGVNLYVKRVFIMDSCKELMPAYLRFVRGMVDTEDLPLNISREILQQNKTVEKIRKALVKKVLDVLTELSSKEPDRYHAFWKEFGMALKEGVYLDQENRDKLIALLRFYSSASQDEKSWVSLKTYCSRMKDGQKEIYYLPGETREEIEASPHLEIFRKNQMEVLYLTDPVDEWMFSVIPEYEGKKVVSAGRGELDLGDLDKEAREKAKEDEKKLKGIEDLFRKILQDEIKSVRTTTRLVDSPCCLVSDEGEMSAHMERILKASKQMDFRSKRILEINPNHALIQHLQSMTEKGIKEEDLQDWISVLYDQALLAEGSKIKDPKSYNTRMNKILLKAIG